VSRRIALVRIVIGRPRRVVGRYLCGVGMARVVVESADDDAAHTVESRCGIAAARIFEILHLAGVSTGEPLLEMIQFGESLSSNNTTQRKTEVVGLLGDPGSESSRRHPFDCASRWQNSLFRKNRANGYPHARFCVSTGMLSDGPSKGWRLKDEWRIYWQSYLIELWYNA